MSKRYTIMVVPDRSSQVRRLRVSKNTLWTFVSIFSVLLITIAGGTLHYFSILDRARESVRLRQENLRLRSDLVSLNEKVGSIQTVLDRTQRFDAKLRAITQLSDPKRHLAIGPYDVQSSGGSSEDTDGVDALVRAIGENPQAAVGLLGQKLGELATMAEKQEGSVRQLENFLRGQKARLSSTPSIWPSRGWVTSGFGVREDPYTGQQTMHKGVDISNQAGVPVMAPASAIVIFNGISGGYGKTLVLDHGFGIKTRYGHLEEVKAQVGERVERGDIVGNIGNTGRSTGPHLHYEVEVNGVVENPQNYILEE